MREIKNYVLIGLILLSGMVSTTWAQTAETYRRSERRRGTNPDLTAFQSKGAELYRPHDRRREARQINFTLPFYSRSQSIGVEIVNGKVVFEGDIILGEEALLGAPGTMSAGNYDRRWKNGVIPFALDRTHPEYNDIKTAIDTLNRETNLTLVPRTNEVDYVEFIAADGCASKVGRQGLKQIINAEDCSVGSLMHEIMHAAGFYHEQSRADRDNFVTINWDNIEAGKEHNFQTYKQRSLTGSDIGHYDYGSIMHYGDDFFSKNDRPTISPKDSSASIGQRTHLSGGDVQGIRSMYPVKSGDIGVPYQLDGPRVAANPIDKWVLTMGDRVLVITNDGRVFAHNLSHLVGQGYQLESNQRVAANPQDKWVLAIRNKIVVITNDGRVFAHDVNGNRVGNAYQIPSPPVAANPVDKWVLAAGDRILVITNYGGVFAHDISHVVGQGYQLRSNQRVAANAVDRWTLALNNPNGSGHRILVMTTDGRVFAHDVIDRNVGDAYQLLGPQVASNAVDKWVLPMHNRNDPDSSFMNSIMVITRDGGTFVHDLSRRF